MIHFLSPGVSGERDRIYVTMFLFCCPFCQILRLPPRLSIGDDHSAATVSSPSSSAVPRRVTQEQELDEMCLLTELLAQDPLFDAIPRNAAPECAPNIFRFRFTGAGAYGMPLSQVITQAEAPFALNPNLTLSPSPFCLKP